MSNWGWSQWIVAVWLIAGLVGNIYKAVIDRQKSLAELKIETLQKKDDCGYRMAAATIVSIVKWFVLAQGGFW